jgi:hypothetical protein
MRLLISFSRQGHSFSEDDKTSSCQGQSFSERNLLKALPLKKETVI